MYAITATVTREQNGWTCTRQVPTFYLDERAQGITDSEHAYRIAREIIDPLGTMTGDTREVDAPVLCIRAEKVSPEPIYYAPREKFERLMGGKP